MTFEEFRTTDGVADWHQDGSGAVVTFGTGDFATGAKLFSQIAALAESANHHPDVEVTYPSVRVRLETHSAGGLTIKDARLAAEISRAAGDLGIAAQA
ncbi:MAG TPA: 4a-hydroxytetrahydrobiopterin dehydratase [Microbacterium sp.]|nr:4a-hydroxytetrahydrobiopterin dehydratase [Microbacterium sp.]